MFRSRLFRRIFLAQAGLIAILLGSLGIYLVFMFPGGHGPAIWGVLALALAVSWSAAAWLARRLTAPLGELAVQARSAVSGANHLPPGADEVADLAAALAALQQVRTDQSQQMRRDQEELRAVLTSMVEGVVVIDRDERIRFLNEAAQRLLALPEASARGQKLCYLVRHPTLVQAVERVFGGETPYVGELEWKSPEPRVLSIHGTLLPGPQPHGAVFVVHDMSQVRSLERHRQEFVSNVSHELKTPLAAIQAAAETLLDGAIEDDRHNLRFVRHIRENAERLSTLVQDLLTLGRIESEEEALEVGPLSLEEAIRGCVGRQEDRARAKGLVLAVEPAAEPLTILADEEALAVILDNLVDNAIKYTAAGGTVRLRTLAAGARAVIEVADTGCGIPERELQRIFERFYRVDRARSRALGGTGLGLSIVKHLTHALGGEVSVASQVGKGSTFTVRLPRAPSAAV